ncbi:NAD-binding protein [Burkholderia sp. A9]|uniref:NAD-binding protein n=1 Tax=Burkholderia sp. A9 TaxID=1365108 RepID=UPI000A7A1CA4|nr:NAD-binding protein [Burkholderia sp. A9]
MMKIGYVGLGALGGQLARRFIGSAELWVWDISEHARTSFAHEQNVHVASSAADLAQQCEIIFVCLPRSSNVRDMVFGENGLSAGLSPGTMIIDQTSGAPEETRQIAKELLKCDVTLIDAAVSASPHIVASGGATLMVAGSDEAFERALPALRIITETIYRCGTRVGDGQAMKIVNNAMNAACRLGTLEVAVLGRKAGVSLADMAPFLNRGQARNQTTDKMLPALVEGKTSTNFALALMLKDVSQAVSLGMTLGVPMHVTNLVRGLLQIGVNTLDSSARLEDMVSVIETLAGTKLAAPVEPSRTDAAVEKASQAPHLTEADQYRVEELLERTIAALCLHTTYECAMAGIRYGLSMQAISNVVNKSSGWSEHSRSLLPALANGNVPDGLDIAHTVRDLNQACSLAIRVGTPLLIANSVRSVWEQALNQVDAARVSSDPTGFYRAMSGVRKE